MIKLKSLNSWLNLNNKTKLEYSVLKGHFPFSENIYPGNCTYFTFFRDPEKRIISHFLHIKSTPTHKLFQKISEKNYSLAELLQNGDAPLFDNCMVRFISGNYQAKLC